MMADIAKYSFAFIGVLFSAFAQISLKKATNFDERSIAWIIILLGSAICYFISFVSYYYALKHFSISRIAPAMTVGVVGMVFAYGVLSGDKVTFSQGLGLVLGVFSVIFLMS